MAARSSQQISMIYRYEFLTGMRVAKHLGKILIAQLLSSQTGIVGSPNITPLRNSYTINSQAFIGFDYKNDKFSSPHLCFQFHYQRNPNRLDNGNNGLESL